MEHVAYSGAYLLLYITREVDVYLSLPVHLFYIHAI